MSNPTTDVTAPDPQAYKSVKPTLAAAAKYLAAANELIRQALMIRLDPAAPAESPSVSGVGYERTDLTLAAHYISVAGVQESLKNLADPVAHLDTLTRP